MKTIMTVEDHEDTRKSIKLILEKSNYKVVEASSGEECLKKLKKQVPDLILMDVMMPGISGWDTLIEIKKNKEWAKIKICFLSVVEISKERKNSLKNSGINGYIMKPFKKIILLKEIKKLIS